MQKRKIEKTKRIMTERKKNCDREECRCRKKNTINKVKKDDRKKNIRSESN